MKKKTKKKFRIGEIRKRKCKITGKIIDMEYIGEENDVENGKNGHLGWFCLHTGEPND